MNEVHVMLVISIILSIITMVMVIDANIKISNKQERAILWEPEKGTYDSLEEAVETIDGRKAVYKELDSTLELMFEDLFYEVKKKIEAAWYETNIFHGLGWHRTYVYSWDTEVWKVDMLVSETRVKRYRQLRDIYIKCLDHNKVIESKKK